MAQAVRGTLLPDTPHRRKSRIGPALLSKRSIGVGGASIPQTDAGQILFGSIRPEQEGNPLHRTIHRNTQDSSAVELEPSDQQQQEVIAPPVPISHELEEPINRLVDVFGQFVEKLESVADINAKLAQFNESFGAFMYGLKMNAENVEWTEVKKKESIWEIAKRLGIRND